MTITQNTRPVPADDSTPDSGWVGPCGCPACDKWTDCDFCGSCSPGLQDEQERWAEERRAYYAELYAKEEEEQRPFGDWLFGDED